MNLTLIFGLVLILLCAGLYALSLKNKLLARLYSPLGLSIAITFLLVVCLAMGLIRQEENPAAGNEFLTRIGMRSLRDSALMLSILLLVSILLGMCCIDRFRTGFKRFSNLIPLGLFITLTSLIAGSHTLERYTLQTWKNNRPIWTVADKDGQPKDLPFALSVEDFRIDYHAPVLYVVESRTGLPLPRRHPQKLTVDSLQCFRFKNGLGPAQKARLLDRDIRILDYIPEAWIGYADGQTTCQARQGDGSGPAVRVETVSLSDQKTDTAWISCGSFIQPPAFLYWDTARVLGMGKLRPAGYTAQITVYETENESGKTRKATLRPNRPVPAGRYDVYLKSYKEDHGFWDPYITLEIVKDPWKPGVTAGIVILLAGLAGSLLQGLVSSRKRKEPEDSLSK